MNVRPRRKSLLGAALVFSGIGLALSACTTPGPEAAYANGYYDYSDYYDPGYFDSFGFVGRDRDHDRRHDHDDGHDHGMHDGNHAGRGPVVVSHSFGGEHSFGGGRSFGGGSGFAAAGGHGGGGGGRR
jgi:hypothetical protein